ncbi:MATE family efflux transporter [Clostridium thermosuccinogenes]|uniref:Probable multidrug resistance protein NorM n=1 Tax=Clostridium thermosuccinogenes TaxID=84032 RepID=A0A2K2F742_9CLOT|nr:MATE family efflux transporter [Pseudoclostridium thermosuccinogenes]AUS97267.1 MATE family efflux transporter [Pseudoclostridium thermosuccinogenes]PNT94609.1 MATE family efflux transporter [Pseudoclostridium thermosuccinogenes]PNT95077.1 MATE family efflux transporter [Pseudoclostridium thermosuccinogenes]
MRKASIERNLTEGNVVKLLIQFALPFMLSNLIQSLYNVADMLIVGYYSGTAAISGVNIGGQVTFILTNIIVGLTVGGTVIIGQYLGSGDRKSVKETIGTLLTFLLIVGIAFTIIMLMVSDKVLWLLQTPEESYQQARDYLDITLLGTVFIFGYNAFSAILRGFGDSRRPLIFISIACTINVVLDLLLVGVYGMAARGAAIATVVSQAISMILCIISLMRSDFIFDFKLCSFRFLKKHFITIVQVGIPISIQNVIVNFSFLVLTTIANSMGVNASAAVGIVGKYNGFAILPAIAVGSSVSAMVAQNMGAGAIDRAKKTFYTGFALAFSITFVVFIITQVFPEQILSVFDDDPNTISAGVEYIRTFSFDYLIVPATFCLNGLVTGSGHTIISSICGILSSIGFRVPIAILFGLVMQKGLGGLGLAAPIASLASGLILLIYYVTGKWKKNTVVKTSM